MRKFLLHFVLLLSYCLLLSTKAQSQLQKIYLHPKAPGSGKQSSFVDSIRFIPLEVKDGISLGTYYNIQATEQYFLLVDYQNKRMLLYLKDGRFIKKISYQKLGNFYPVYHEQSNQVVFFGGNKNYSLTPKDRIKITLDWKNPRNKKYFKKYIVDLNDPSLSIKKDVPNERDIIKAYPFYKDYYIQGGINISPLYKDSLDHELKIYKNNRLVKSFFPYNHINETRFLYTEENAVPHKTDISYIHFITRPYCDTIYKMVNDSLFSAYQLVLPLENSLPASFFTRPFKNKTERENFNRNNGWMFHQVYSFYETSGFIYFMVGYLSNYDSYMYQKKTNVTYKIKNIKPDSSQYNLALLADFNLIRKGDRFYKPQKAGDLLAFFEQNKNAVIPKELEEFLKSKPHSAAPVIVEFKFKN